MSALFELLCGCWVVITKMWNFIYGNAGLPIGGVFFYIMLVTVLASFVVCLKSNDANKWKIRCYSSAVVAFLATAPIMINYLFKRSSHMASCIPVISSADIIALHVLFIVGLIGIVLVCFVRMYIEKQRNELQVKIKAVDGALKKLWTEL